MQIHIYCQKPGIGTSERNYITNQKNVSVVHERIRSMSFTHSVSKQHAYLISYLTMNKVDCLHLMFTIYIATMAALIWIKVGLVQLLLQ